MRITAPDSIANPFARDFCVETEAPSSSAERLEMPAGKLPYTSGIEPEGRTLLPGYDPGVLCLLIVVFILLAYNFRHYSTFLKNFMVDLWSVRRTERTFTVRTMSEVGIQGAIVLVACLCEGIIMDVGLSLAGIRFPIATFSIIGLLTLTAALYYFWQLGVYSIVGFVFTDKLSARQWIKGFNASQALLGILLVIPALFVLFNPDRASLVVGIGVSCYLLARSIFIFKGFRLFYDNFGSILYFILYLCTLEIVPVVVIFRCIAFLSRLTA